MIWVRSLIALGLLALAHSTIAQNYQGKELVHATLLADTSAIVPGKPFTAGVLLRVAPGWHTYWKYSGDAGLPTEIKWNLPPGWKVGEIQWPIPLKTNDPGDIQTYGYQDELLLMQEITPPSKIDISPVKLSAQVDWLVCERICIPGNAKLELELPTSTTAEPKNSELFARYRRLVPQNFPDGKTATVNWTRTGNDLLLKITSDQIANYQNIDFFPAPQGNETVVGHPTVTSRSANQVTFKIPIESPDKNVSALPGVIVFSKSPNGNDRTGWELAAEQAAATSNQIAQPSRSLATFLLFGFIGGFILNLMPCVLPVISLKIFGFIKQAGQSRARIFRSGVAFTAGIFVWFMALAILLVALKGAGRDVTWGGFQFTNAYFVLALSVIVLIFALNLFGVFEISLPQSLQRGMLASGDRTDDFGSFFQGVFATVLATPCTAPFLGTALGFAFSQSAVVILAMFAAVAAGMSAPYLLLSAQPAWMRFLPQPGPWMVHVKQFMGFLLIATLLFLLYVLGAQRGLDGAIWASCFLLIVAIACWMKGAFILPTTSGAKRAVVVLLMLLLLLGSGVYFIGDKFQSSKIDIAETSASSGGWQSFTPERLQTERDAGHAVFVDFTAAWCLTCKFNEKAVLETSDVRDAFQRHAVVKLKADWTNGDPQITKLLQQFGRPGVPLYVLYPGKSHEPIVFPELLTKSILLDKLETITVASR
ncbi:MAG TPA: protein-disulfide reductase DsbD domain-containing protein [Chthoniobacterales bacterium]|nr:protein-disulfide reductase DsbD domain-containing protein [Chthoniobacterales bacterium]